MAMKLPPSLQKELHPVEEEVAWARGLTSLLLLLACTHEPPRVVASPVTPAPPEGETATVVVNPPALIPSARVEVLSCAEPGVKVLGPVSGDDWSRVWVGGTIASQVVVAGALDLPDGSFPALPPWFTCEVSAGRLRIVQRCHAPTPVDLPAVGVCGDPSTAAHVVFEVVSDASLQEGYRLDAPLLGAGRLPPERRGLPAGSR